MAEIRPFSGVRYPANGADLAKLLAPPYDIITPAGREKLLARDPRNVVRLILASSPEASAYEEAGKFLRDWMDDGALAADETPSLYVLEQRFEAEGRRYERHGLLARFRAEDPERGIILPHEQTRKAPKEDRIRMLRATRANFSPIFLMVPDGERGFMDRLEAIEQASPAVEYGDDEGVEHRLWVVTDPSEVSSLQELLREPAAYIADGHHRHATALRRRDEVGPDAAWTLGFFTPMESPGLVVLPYHRILEEGPSAEEARRTLGEKFEVSDASGVADAARRAGASKAPFAFGLAWPGGDALVAEAKAGAVELIPAATPPSLEALDPFFFHRVVLERLFGIGDESIDYVHSLAEAEEAVAAGRCRLAGLMRPTPVQQIKDVSDARESMPAKSTFFHPKLPSGLVIHPLVE